MSSDYFLMFSVKIVLMANPEQERNGFVKKATGKQSYDKVHLCNFKVNMFFQPFAI